MTYQYSIEKAGILKLLQNDEIGPYPFSLAKLIRLEGFRNFPDHECLDRGLHAGNWKGFCQLRLLLHVTQHASS